MNSPKNRRLPAFLAVLVALLGSGLGVAAAAPAQAASTGTLYVIHGIIGQNLDVYVDGKKSLGSAAPKSIVGPLRLSAGTHEVEMRKGSDVVAKADVAVRAGSNLDVVAHLKADASAGSEITSYANDLRPVSRGKLRLAIAHVAAAPPADIKVDGKVLFSNVANGEALKIVVPGATYRVAVVPAATGGSPILGPVDLAVKSGTLTRVFAVGDVTKGSMDAVVHSLPVSQTGSGAPDSVQTGNGGQAATSFVDPTSGSGRDPGPALLAGLVLGVAGLGLLLRGGTLPRLRASLGRQHRI